MSDEGDIQAVNGIIQKIDKKEETSFNFEEISMVSTKLYEYKIVLYEYFYGGGQYKTELYKTTNGCRCIRIFELLKTKLKKRNACNKLREARKILNKAEQEAKELGC